MPPINGINENINAHRESTEENRVICIQLFVCSFDFISYIYLLYYLNLTRKKEKRNFLVGEECCYF